MIKEELKQEAEEYFKHKQNHSYADTEEQLAEDIITAYLASAEPREKRIEELEMTVGTLRTFSNEQATCIERLEKENAELRNRNQELLESCEGATMMYEHLTKAKEIIQKLIANAPDTYSGTNIELQQRKMFSFQDAENKAEQFLNSEVEK